MVATSRSCGTVAVRCDCPGGSTEREPVSGDCHRHGRDRPALAGGDGLPRGGLQPARVEGRFQGQIAIGRVANAPGGFGRLFHVELVDSVGGVPWEWSSLPDKKGPGLTRTFEGDPQVKERLLSGIDFEEAATVVPDDRAQRFGFLYDPAAGMVRLTREMRTRLDIPDAETFTRQLETLQRIGEANRHAQGANGE